MCVCVNLVFISSVISSSEVRKISFCLLPYNLIIEASQFQPLCRTQVSPMPEEMHAPNIWSATAFLCNKFVFLSVCVWVFWDRNSSAKKRLAWVVEVVVEVAVEVASSRLLLTSLAFSSFSSKRVLHYASSQRGTNQYWFSINKCTTFLHFWGVRGARSPCNGNHFSSICMYVCMYVSM